MSRANVVAWVPVLALLLPLLGAVAVPGLPAVRSRPTLARGLGVAVSGATLALVVSAAFAVDLSRAGTVQLRTDLPWVPALDLRFHLGVDGMSLPLLLLTALLTFLGLLHSARFMPEPGRDAAYVGLVLLLEVGTLGTFLALDLLLFFVFFEVVLIPMYFLIAGWGGEGRTAAAYTFILYTLLGSAVLLLGFLLVHHYAGSGDITALTARRGAGMSHRVQLVAAGAMMLGFAVKTPAWPLHTWLPDAHTAAPTVGSVLLAGVLLKMGIYGLLRIVVPVTPGGFATLAPYLGAFAVVGVVYGSLACLAQRDLKRLIAYSSVGHMGFGLLGIATLTAVGLNGALFTTIGHGLITGLLFFLAGAVKDRHRTVGFADLGGGLYQRAPRLGALLAFAAVASLGLPGLAGFWGEMFAMFGAFAPGPGLHRGTYLTYLVLAGLGTVLTAAYLLVTVRRVCMGTSAASWGEKRIGDVSGWEAGVWAPLVVLTVVIGLWPAVLLGITTPAVQTLLGGR